jgi:hypothetical protein
MRRVWVLVSIGFLCLLVLQPLGVQAGDENNPEVLDTDNDSESGETHHDLLWGYIGHEDNDTFAVVIGVSSLETFTNPNDILNFPVTDYEFYFSVLGVDYAAVATVPVHGPFGIDIQYELRTVQYNGSTPTSEAQKASISTADYDAVNGIINMTVRKSDVGNPAKGDLAENLWCAVYSRARDGQFNLSEPSLEDRAPNLGYGKIYLFRGSQGGEVINVELSTEAATVVNMTPFQTLKIDIRVKNNGTPVMDLRMNNSSHADWKIYFVPSSLTLEPLQEDNVTLVIKMNNLKRIKDGEKLVVQAWAEADFGNETVGEWKVVSNYLTVSITADVPPPEEEEKGFFEEFLDKLKDFYDEQGTNLLYAIAGIIVVIVLVAVFAAVRGRRKEEDEHKDVDIKVDGSEPGPGPPEEPPVP